MTLDTLTATALTALRSPVVSLPPIAVEATHAVGPTIGAVPGSSIPPAAVAATRHDSDTTDAMSVGRVVRALHTPPAGAVRRG